MPIDRYTAYWDRNSQIWWCKAWTMISWQNGLRYRTGGGGLSVDRGTRMPVKLLSATMAAKCTHVGQNRGAGGMSATPTSPTHSVAVWASQNRSSQGSTVSTISPCERWAGVSKNRGKSMSSRWMARPSRLRDSASIQNDHRCSTVDTDRCSMSSRMSIGASSSRTFLHS